MHRRSEASRAPSLEEGLGEYLDQRGTPTTPSVRRAYVPEKDIDRAEVERFTERLCAVYSKLDKVLGVHPRKGSVLFAYYFDEPQNAWDEENERNEVMKAIGDIPLELQSSVFERLMSVGRIDEALDLVLVKKITRVSPQGTEVLLKATETGKEKWDWDAELSRVTPLTTKNANPHTFSLDEDKIPFLTYFKALDQPAEAPAVRAYIKHWGLLDVLPEHLDEFPEIPRNRLIAKYRELRRPDILANHIEKFSSVNHEVLFRELLHSSDRRSREALANNIDKFHIDEHIKAVELLRLCLQSSPSGLQAVKLSLAKQEYVFRSLVERGYSYDSGLPQVIKWELSPEWMVRCMRQAGVDATVIDSLITHQDWGDFRPLFSRETAEFLFDHERPNSVIRRLPYFEDVDENRLLGQLSKSHDSGKPLPEEGYVFEFLRQRYSFEDAITKIKVAVESPGLRSPTLSGYQGPDFYELPPHGGGRVDWILEKWAKDYSTEAIIKANDDIDVAALSDLVQLVDFPWRKPSSSEFIVGRINSIATQLPSEVLVERLAKEELFTIALTCLRSHHHNSSILDRCIFPRATPEDARAISLRCIEMGIPLTRLYDASGSIESSFSEKCGIIFARDLAAKGYPELIAKMIRCRSKAEMDYSREDIVHAIAFYSRNEGQWYFSLIRDSIPQLQLNHEIPFSDPRMESIWRDWNDTTIPLREKEELLALDFQEPDEVRHARRNAQISPVEAKSILGSGDTWVDQDGNEWAHKEALDMDKKGKIKNKELLLEALLSEAKWPTLGMDTSIVSCIRRGRELFGSSIMLAYMNRPDVSRHDAAHFMDQIEALYQKSGLSAKQFAQNILLQVAKDTASYESGTSYTVFALACSSLNNASFDPSDEHSVLSKLEHWRKTLPELGATIDLLRRDGPFASWTHLKAAHEAYDISQRQELMQQLQDEPNTRLRRFVATLAFTPGISMDSVFQLWHEPHRFFDVSDTHAPEGLQDAKKPSNYLTVAHLDWTAADLRDAAVGREGEASSALDRLQTIPTMDRTYTVIGRPENDVRVPENLHRLLLEALGNRQRGIRGRAQDPGKVFSSLGSILQKLGLGMKAHATTLIESPLGLTYLREHRTDLYHEIQEILFDARIGMPRPAVDEQTFRVRIGKKSDPGMVVTGNDAGGCMPFGSGKGNVYWCNPNCAQLVVQRQVGQDKWKTIAQSVVTINQQTSQLVPDIVEIFRKDPKALTSLMKTEDFSLPRYMACDNIEVEKNQAESYGRVLAKAYEAFWRGYLEKHAQTLRVSPEKVLVGKGYSPADMGLRSEPNETIPLVPMSYSDNLHQQSFVLETGLEAMVPETRPYVRPIEVTDVYAIAHLESKAFADTSMGYGIHQVQNNLVGIGIANEYFGRPNLSFIVQEDGKPASAYIVAYEGRARDEKIVYVDDMAASERGNPAGGRALLAFVNAYIGGYQNEATFPPIVANLRDQTSFQLVLNHFERLARHNGLLTEMVEHDGGRRGADVMHPVTILVARSREELNDQKQRVFHFNRHNS